MQSMPPAHCGRQWAPSWLTHQCVRPLRIGSCRRTMRSHTKPSSQRGQQVLAHCIWPPSSACRRCGAGHAAGEQHRRPAGMGSAIIPGFCRYGLHEVHRVSRADNGELALALGPVCRHTSPAPLVGTPAGVRPHCTTTSAAASRARDAAAALSIHRRAHAQAANTRQKDQRGDLQHRGA